MGLRGFIFVGVEALGELGLHARVPGEVRIWWLVPGGCLGRALGVLAMFDMCFA